MDCSVTVWRSWPGTRPSAIGASDTQQWRLTWQNDAIAYFCLKALPAPLAGFSACLRIGMNE